MRPILSALLRNKTGAVLVVIQIAITLAIVVNALFIVNQRLALIGRPTGMDEANIFSLYSFGFTSNFRAGPTIQQDLRTLRGLPGVIDATPINLVPMSSSGSDLTLTAQRGENVPGVDAGIYDVDEHGLNALGLKLIAGRNFTHQEVDYVDPEKDYTPPVVIVTQGLAKALFPNGGALGKTLYWGGKKPSRIVGIVKRFYGNDYSGHIGWSILLPDVTTAKQIAYVVRAQPGQRDRLMPKVEKMLGQSNRDRTIMQMSAMSKTIAGHYREDRAMAVILIVVIALLIAVTALGIFGLAVFNVNRRRKQIGIRRALGARRVDIIGYFMTESWLMTTIGVVIGSALAVGLNYWLVMHYAVPRLAWYYVPAGIGLLWVLGAVAVLMPALRAASIPPAVATRTV
ncbi:MAG TPA: FtsX-like permease family protein [Gammaproteobacteria bacterium]|nr:FtsX-like permease family protein [Gammaproteobacteria bacterium]